LKKSVLRLRFVWIILLSLKYKWVQRSVNGSLVSSLLTYLLTYKRNFHSSQRPVSQALTWGVTHVVLVIPSAIVDLILKLTETVINTKEQFLQLHLGSH
jgi:hypothetical protein